MATPLGESSSRGWGFHGLIVFLYLALETCKGSSLRENETTILYLQFFHSTKSWNCSDAIYVCDMCGFQWSTFSYPLRTSLNPETWKQAMGN